MNLSQLQNSQTVKHAGLISIREQKYHYMLFKVESSNYFGEIHVLAHFPEIFKSAIWYKRRELSWIMK